MGKDDDNNDGKNDGNDNGHDGFKPSSYDDGVYAFKSHEALPTPFENHVARMIQPEYTVLDIGSGNGQFSDFACRKGARVFALDALARNKEVTLKREAIANAADKGLFQFVLGTWPQSWKKLDALGFDLIFSQSVLHYLDEAGRQEAFRTVLHALNRGGYFALALKSTDNAWMEKRDDKGELVLTRLPGDEPRWDNSIDHSIRTFFTVQRLKEELQRAGFKALCHNFNVRIVSDYEFKGELSVWIEFLYQKI